MRCAICDNELRICDSGYVEPCRTCQDDAYEDGFHDGQLSAEEEEIY